MFFILLILADSGLGHWFQNRVWHSSLGGFIITVCDLSREAVVAGLLIPELDEGVSGLQRGLVPLYQMRDLRERCNRENVRVVRCASSVGVYVCAQLLRHYVPVSL